MRLMLLLALLAPLTAAPAHAAQPVTFYVSPWGSDTWSGRLPDANARRTDGPFATIPRAQAAVRLARRAYPGRPCRVLLRGGTHVLSDTLTFTPEDAGSATAPVSYEAYPGETPVISGGRLISGWRRGPGRLWVAGLPEVKRGVWYFHQLFVNGQRRQRARHPNEGYLTTQGPLPEIPNPQQAMDNPTSRLGFTFRPGDLRRWPDLADVNVVLYYDWDTSHHWIASLDEEKHVVRFSNPSQWPVCYWETQQRYHLEGFLGGLDAPGEWCLERSTGRLYYWPLPGEALNKVKAVAPRLRHLVRLRGAPEQGQFVEHLRFAGLSFQHADWVLGRTDRGQGQAADFLSAAILAEGARHCRFERVEIAHTGEYALWLQKGCRDNRIRHCHLHDLGGGGIRIGEPGIRSEPALQTERNEVDNCFIHDGGHAFPPAVGIWIGQSSRNRITHNEISDLRYTGISVGWTWGYAPTLCHDNLVAYNHVHHLGFGVLSELSCIYTLGDSRGTRIRNNLLHDTYDYRYGSWGIGLDEGTANILVEGNVIYNHGHGIGLHYGTGNVVRNNLVAFCRSDLLGVGRIEEHVPWRLTRNVLVSNNGVILAPGWSQRRSESDENLYWDTRFGADADLDGRSFEEWQALGQDRRSVFADPLFVDAAKGDFRFRPGSPAAKLGIRPFDVRAAGLYGEPPWVAAPRRIRRRPVAPVVQARLAQFQDGFEETPVGAGPNLVHVSGEEKGASIRVTDETAAHGRHSLKFTDAPGLAASWQPHLWYSPSIVRGAARLSFDVRLEEGAILVHQWRDYRLGGDNFRTGPTLTFAAGKPILAGDRPVVELPAGQWAHVEVSCAMGRQPGRTWSLEITLQGRRPLRLTGLPVSAEFRHFAWAGFISDATDRAVSYLDNVQLTSSPR